MRAGSFSDLFCFIFASLALFGPFLVAISVSFWRLCGLLGSLLVPRLVPNRFQIVLFQTARRVVWYVAHAGTISWPFGPFLATLSVPFGRLSDLLASFLEPVGAKWVPMETQGGQIICVKTEENNLRKTDGRVCSP